MLALIPLWGALALASPSPAEPSEPAASDPATRWAHADTNRPPRGATPTKQGTDAPVESDEGEPSEAADASDPAPPPTNEAKGSAAGSRRGLSWRRADDPTPERRFILGIEGVVIQAPPLRPDVVSFDPRFIGRSVSLAGLGLLGRMRLHPRIGVEAVVRSGSVRYAAREGEDDAVVSHDQVMADLGVLLFVARGDMAHLAFDAGLGGMGTRISYELSRNGTQLFGSGLVRVGADAEFLVKRIAFVVSVRAYGVFTDRDRVRNDGELLQDKTVRSPVPTLQTYLVGSAGIAYRF